MAVSVLFLPHYFRGEMFTAYELMRRRFGERIRRFTAAIFLVTRALAEGVRVFAISLVISIVLGTGEAASIVLIVCLTLFYTFEGGMTAVIWTDVVQMGLYVARRGRQPLRDSGQDPRRLGARRGRGRRGRQAAGFRFPILADHAVLLPQIFLLGGPGGRLFSDHGQPWHRSAHGAAPAERPQRAQSRRALLASWLVIFFQFSLFLAIGLLLFVYYRDTHLVAPRELDRIYPEFVWRHLPVGVAGLVTAAILAAAMANLSAALNRWPPRR